jgi:hypothetical protein
VSRPSQKIRKKEIGECGSQPLREKIARTPVSNSDERNLMSQAQSLEVIDVLKGDIVARSAQQGRVGGRECDVLMFAPWIVTGQLRRPPPNAMLGIVAGGERADQGPPNINFERCAILTSESGLGNHILQRSPPSTR